MSRELAERAIKLRTAAVPQWNEFMDNWRACNALYKPESGATEREQAMNVIRHLSVQEATDILAQLPDAIAYFSALPPGDMRKGNGHPNFRQRSADDMAVVNNASENPNTRLSHLIGVVYQIRCNLEHAEKDPSKERDIELVTHSISVMNEVLPALISAMSR